MFVLPKTLHFFLSTSAILIFLFKSASSFHYIRITLTNEQKNILCQFLPAGSGGRPIEGARIRSGGLPEQGARRGCAAHRQLCSRGAPGKAGGCAAAVGGPPRHLSICGHRRRCRCTGESNCHAQRPGSLPTKRGLLVGGVVVFNGFRPTFKQRGFHGLSVPMTDIPGTQPAVPEIDMPWPDTSCCTPLNL